MQAVDIVIEPNYYLSEHCQCNECHKLVYIGTSVCSIGGNLYDFEILRPKW